jgi:signal transduction histidine kinase/ActR/RegA family two-component response regulator
MERTRWPTGLARRIWLTAALSGVAALLTLAAFAAVSAHAGVIAGRALDWSQHAVAVGEVGGAAHAHLAAIDGVVAGQADLASLEATERAVRDAVRRCGLLASSLSAEEVAEEEELSRAVDRLVDLGREAAGARSRERRDAARRWVSAEVAPRIAHRLSEEQEGASAAVAAARRHIREWLAGALLVSMALGAVALWRSWSLARHLTTAMRALVEGARRITSGHLGWRVLFRSDDELGVLANAFDEMARALAGNLVTRDELARQVAERTADLERSRRELEDRLVELRDAQAQLVARERMAAIGLLAAGVAHEINNPLAFVLSNVRFALDELGRPEPAARDAAEAARALHEAARGIERMKDIVGGLRGLSRAEDDEAASVELDKAVEATLRLAWNEIRHQALLVRELRPAPPVSSTEGRIGQLVLNLVVNALQAMPSRDSSRNAVRVSTLTSEAGWAVIEVADNGTGMTAEVRSRLFEPFFTTKPRGVGTGLGLSMCKRVVDAAGGRIAVESEPGVGTTFRIELPPAGRPAPGAVESPAADEAAPAPARVLVVDDEPLICSSVRRTLGRHEVVAATNAREALERLRGGERFDVLVCDVMMPGMSGIQLVEELLRAGSDAARRVVFLTGGALSAEAQDLIGRAQASALEKPFEPAALRAAVDRVLRARGPSARGRGAPPEAAVAS